jgi:predicted acyltransferase
MTSNSAMGMGKPGRVLSVDVLRGITIALMILVNDAGDFGHTFTQLDHAKWNGWTLTDLVFPTFLFLIGVSIVFSMAARAAKGDCRKTQAGHIFLRFVKLAVLAWALNYFPRMHWTMRIYGVLMRIAICYLVGALVLLAVSLLRERWRAGAVAMLVTAILLGYWALMRFAKVPGAGHPEVDFPLLDPMWNLAAYTDRGISAWMLAHLHTGKLYEGTRDPEGLLSTLPAVGTLLVGALVGMWMRRPEWMRGKAERNAMLRGINGSGALLILVGEFWSRWFPVNKNLWTSSYVLVSAGVAMIVLGLLSQLVDGREGEWPRWLRVATWPWLVFGSNAIAAFTISIVLVKTMLFFHGPDVNGKHRTLWWHAYYDVFARHGSNDWTSLAFAVCFVCVCFLPVWMLWRKRIFLRM